MTLGQIEAFIAEEPKQMDLIALCPADVFGCFDCYFNSNRQHEAGLS